MSFTILQKNTTITASEVNDNFLHVGQGDLLPRGGTSLTAVGSTYNTGSDQYRWDAVNINSIYADTANINKITGNFYFLDSYEINSINTTTSRISFDITGYSYRFIEISIYLAQCSANAYIYLNGNSTVSHYLCGRGYSVSTEIFFASTTTAPMIARSGDAENINCTYSRALLTIYQGDVRNVCMWTSINGSADPYASTYIRGIFDYTSSSAITSLVFTGQFYTGASIKLWGIA